MKNIPRIFHQRVTANWHVEQFACDLDDRQWLAVSGRLKCTPSRRYAIASPLPPELRMQQTLSHCVLLGKGSNWEGGTRVPAFVTGGILPAAMRGKTLQGPLHIADW